MRDVEALHPPRPLRQAEGFLERILNGACRRLHYPEALIKGLFGIIPGKINERPLLAPLRNHNLDTRASSLGRYFLAEKVLQGGMIFEINRHEDGPRHILRVNIELL